MTDAINSHSRRMYNAQKKTRDDLEATASPSIATPLDDPRVKALVEAVRHEREMVCQDFDMQLAAARAVDAALSAIKENK